MSTRHLVKVAPVPVWSSRAEAARRLAAPASGRHSGARRRGWFAHRQGDRRDWVGTRADMLVEDSKIADTNPMNDATSLSLTEALAEWVFRPVAEERHKFRGLAGFCPLRGCRYQGELMVVGRAINGWRDEACLPKGPAGAGDLERIACELSKISMSWVSRHWQSRPPEYNTRRSAFWRVIRSVSLKLVAGARDDDWPTHLVWSNLYKVAPWAGGNPPAALQHVQRDGCKKLLNLEISAFRPKRVLFLTGWNWAQQLVDVSPGMRQPAGAQLVDKVWDRPLASEPGSPASRFVVAAHPRGKGDQRWTSEVLEAFR